MLKETPASIVGRLARTIRKITKAQTFEECLQTRGVALLRSFIPEDLAKKIEARFEENLKRCALYSDLETNAARNGFSLAMAFADPADETLAFDGCLASYAAAQGQPRVAGNCGS